MHTDNGLGAGPGIAAGKPSALATIATAAGVLALAYASLVFTRDIGRIAAVWPANAVVVAILLRTASPSRWRFLVAGVLGIVGANLLFGDAPVTALQLSACNGLEIGLCAGLLRRLSGARLDLSRQSHLLWFLAVAGLAAPLASATCAAIALGLGQATPFLNTVVAWYAPDALGLLIVTPALLAMTYRDVAGAARQLARGRGLASLGALGLAMAIVFGQTRYPLFFLIPPALIYVAFELGLAGAAAMLLATSAAATVMTLAGFGPAALIHGGLVARLGVLQLFLATVTIAVLPVAAALAKRDRLDMALRRSLDEMAATRRRIEENEARYRLLADASPDIILKVDRHDVVQYVSPSAKRYGFEPKAMIGRRGADFIHPEDRAEVLARVALIAAGGAPDPGIDRSFRVQTDDGVTMWVEANSAVVRDNAGAPAAIVTQMRDVSERRAATAALADSEARYRLLTDSSPDLVLKVDGAGVIQYISPSVRRYGYEPGDLVGTPSVNVVHPEDLAKVRALTVDLFAGAEPDPARDRTYRIRTADGGHVWMEGNPAIIRDAAGAPVAVITQLRDISDRRAATVALQAARAAAEDAAAVKSAFMANMSHEIRTPLTSILGFTGLLSNHAALDATARAYVDRVAGAGQALLSLVNDILDFSKLEAGRVEISRKPTAPGDLARDALLMFTPQASDKGLTLVFEAADSLPPCLLIDPDRVRQILLNLIGNAVKFTEAGQVRVAARYDARAERLEVQVIDTGAGLTRTQQRKLFQRFSQVDASSTRRHGGTGLGLAISRGLAEAMGGMVGVRSKRGEGSVFYLRVTAPAAQFDAAQATAVQLPTLEGLRVLVADDNPANRDLVRAILAPFDVRVTEAADGRDAVEAAARAPVDVILMDIRMPGLDGPAAAAAIREGGGPNQDVAILAFSADLDLARFEIAGSAFDGIVRKPIAADQLIAALARATSPETDLSASRQDTRHAAG